MKKISVLVIAAICFSSCFNNYYKVKSNYQWNEDWLQTIQKSDKHIVIHFTNTVRELENPVFDAEQISGELKNYLPRLRFIEPDTSIKENLQYEYPNRKILFSELHVYVNVPFSGQRNFTITNANFVSSYANVPNKGLSIFSHALGVTIILGIISLAAVVTVTSAFAATTLNCPQAYIEISPGQYQFIGGMFTGSVRPDLQRNDMIPLTGLLTTADTVRIRIKGMQDETQFIDHASVKEIIHPEGTEVVGNSKGEFFIIRHLKMPNEVKAGNAVDRSKTLLFRDGQSYGFHMLDSLNNSHIQLKFIRKETDKKAVLVARMKNSIWSGYINDQLKKAGTNPFAILVGCNSAITSSTMKISVMTMNGWKDVGYFPPAGNTSTKDLAMEIDLSEVGGRDVLIKMEAPYRFWDVDHVGLSYETVKTTDIVALRRASVIVKNHEISNAIDKEDGKYFQLESTDQLDLEYIKSKRKNTPGSLSTYMLVTGGYYLQSSKNNLPMVNKHRYFSDPVSLNHYSMARYLELGFSK